MKKEMLINVLQPEETRIAILEDDVLEELYIERGSQESFVGNIYKGRIVNIEPSIQAAFVDFGVGRNGFLHISDVDPQYFGGNASLEDIYCRGGGAGELRRERYEGSHDADFGEEGETGAATTFDEPSTGGQEPGRGRRRRGRGRAEAAPA